MDSSDASLQRGLGIGIFRRINTETIFLPASDWYAWLKSIPKRWLM
jgi:hypothetical protein